MAKKRRTPPPPRPVQSPKARTAERSPEDWRRLLILVGIAASGFVGLGIVLLLYALSGGGGGANVAEAMRAASCTLQTVPVRYPGGSATNRHYSQLPKGYKYPSFPPAGGPHDPTPAPFDAYDEPVSQQLLVHNLEHGAVVIQYGRDVAETQIEAILAWYRENPNGIVLAPLPALGDRISLAAWNADLAPTGEVRSERSYLAKCPRFDEDAFASFRDEYGFKGPERFPEDSLTPGS